MKKAKKVKVSTLEHDQIVQGRKENHIIEKEHGKNLRFVEQGKRQQNRIWPMGNEGKKGRKI